MLKEPVISFSNVKLFKINTDDKIETLVRLEWDGFQYEQIYVGKKYLFAVNYAGLHYNLKYNSLSEERIKLDFPYTTVLTLEIVDDVIIVNDRTSGWQNFLNVDKILPVEITNSGHNHSYQKFFDTPLDIFLYRYHNFYKEILRKK